MENNYYEAWPTSAGCKRVIANYGGDFASFGWLSVNGAGVSRGSAPALPFRPPAMEMVPAAMVPQIVLHAGAGA